VALLATEFIWARRLLKDLKRRTQAIADRADAIFITKHPRPWLIPFVLAGLGAAIYVAYAHLGLTPHWQKMVLYASVGPVLAVLFWAYMTVKRYQQLHRHIEQGSPAAAVEPAVSVTPVGNAAPHVEEKAPASHGG
jgi:hypothetical protein